MATSATSARPSSASSRNEWCTSDWPDPRIHENTAPMKHSTAARLKARRRPLPKGPAMRFGKKLRPVR